MPILPGIEEAVSNSNFKYKGELSLDQVALQRDEAIAHWGATNKIREAYLMRGTRDFAQEDVGEAMAQQQMRTGNSVAETNANVGVSAALVAAIAQIVAKLGQTTPPETGKVA